MIQYNHYRDMLAFGLPICFHPAHRLALHHIMGAMPEIWRIWPGWFMLSFQGKFCCKMAWWCIQITWSTLRCGISDCYSKSKTSLMLNDKRLPAKSFLPKWNSFSIFQIKFYEKSFFNVKSEHFWEDFCLERVIVSRLDGARRVLYSLAALLDWLHPMCSCHTFFVKGDYFTAIA